MTKGVQTGAVATGHSRQGGAEQPRQNILWLTTTKMSLV